jgi:hypothetical protein
LKHGIYVIWFLVLLSLLTGSVSGRTIFVCQSSAAVTQDGSSWVTAFSTVQDGIAGAVSGDEIWVAMGVYQESLTIKEPLKNAWPDFKEIGKLCSWNRSAFLPWTENSPERFFAPANFSTP